MRSLMLSVALVCSFSVAALGQINRDRQSSDAGPAYDPFDVWQVEVKALDAGWPDNNRSAHNANETRTASTVSFRELQHKVPKPALKEYNKGIRALNDGKIWLAEERLQNALNIDPDFADAHNNLGVAVGDVGETNQAIGEFEKAVELAPKNTAALTNLSVALYFKRRYHEVCQIARRSLAVDPTLTQVRYVFALSLIADHGDSNEALANLDRAAREYPEAHIAASNLLVKIGRPDDAARHLQAYLESAQIDDPTKAEVQARLAELRP